MAVSFQCMTKSTTNKKKKLKKNEKGVMETKKSQKKNEKIRKTLDKKEIAWWQI